MQVCPNSTADLGVCPRQDYTHSATNFVASNYVPFGCRQPAHYSDLATLFFNTQVTPGQGQRLGR